jgi:hypothetical protein
VFREWSSPIAVKLILEQVQQLQASNVRRLPVPQLATSQQRYSRSGALLTEICPFQRPVANFHHLQEAIYDGIQMAADASGVDHRLILAIIMQESHGCVRVNTTNLGVRNPGIMQNHNGKAYCNDNKKLTTPCPAATIHEMIREGTSGTSSGDGLAHCINLSGNGDVSDYYRAARIYNSGSISKTGNLESNIATHCYASDVAK